MSIQVLVTITFWLQIYVLFMQILPKIETKLHIKTYVVSYVVKSLRYWGGGSPCTWRKNDKV